MTENIRVLIHSSIKLTGKTVVYIDPFRVNEKKPDADIILITHDHFDHFSPEDIAKIIKSDTVLVVPEKMKKQAGGISCGKLLTVAPGDMKQIGDVTIETIPAYNKLKPFHPKKSGWVGYIVTINDTRIYIAGDTDITEENRAVSCDVAMVPIGGTYTMNAKDAAELVNTIKPQVAIPIHYGSVSGSKKDADVFQANVDSGITVEIKMEA
ncbi:MAG: MBL fold metallo-hydrolase [Lachnospiraceae bacterium]|nr:MBL fold metallo-hydrolase [Lachnospiraceae bacterium]